MVSSVALGSTRWRELLFYLQVRRERYINRKVVHNVEICF